MGDQSTSSSTLNDYLCEWADCSFSCRSIDQLCTHLHQHVDEIFSMEFFQLSNVDWIAVSLPCSWKGCDFTATEADSPSMLMSTFRRHIFVHPYHSKLKQIGQRIRLEKNLPTCRLPVEERNNNQVPLVRDTLRCAYPCCMYATDEILNYYTHINEHCRSIISDESGTFRCFWPSCPFTAKRRNHISNHLRTHTQEKLCACDLCGALFSTRHLLICHLDVVNELADDGGLDEDGRSSSPEIHQCTVCDRRFSKAKYLRHHVRSHVNRYKCPHCPKVFNFPRTVQRHLLYVHSSVRRLSCPVCPARFKTWSDCLRHIDLVHPDEAARGLLPEQSDETTVDDGCSPMEQTDDFLKLEPPTDGSASTVERIRRKTTGQRRPAKPYAKKGDGLYACHVCTKRYARSALLRNHLVKDHEMTFPASMPKIRFRRGEDGLYRLMLSLYEYEDTEVVTMSSLPVDRQPDDRQPDDRQPDDQPNEVGVGSLVTVVVPEGQRLCVDQDGKYLLVPADVLDSV